MGVKWTREQLDRIQGGKKAVLVSVPTGEQLKNVFKLAKVDADSSIFIPGEVPSSKNSKRIIYKTASPGVNTNWRYLKAGAMLRVIPFIVDSEFSVRYRKAVQPFYRKNAFRFRNMAAHHPLPAYAEFIFIRGTNRKWDYNNLTEVVQDLMVENGWVDEDDVKHLLPCPPPRGRPTYIVNKEIQGVIIRLRDE